MLHAVVPAAGVGSRMQADLPKQYLPLAGKRVIEQTLDLLLRVSGIETITVAISDGDPYWPELPISRHARINRAPGGAERADSVLNALRRLRQQAAGDDWVLVHAGFAIQRLEPDEARDTLAAGLDRWAGAAAAAADGADAAEVVAVVEGLIPRTRGAQHGPQGVRLISATGILDGHLNLVGDHPGLHGHRAGRRDVARGVHDQAQQHLVQLGGVSQDRRRRRQAFAQLRDEKMVAKLFDVLGERYKDRNGGYSRVLKAGFRYGDMAPMAIIELVDRDPAAKGKADRERVAAEEAMEAEG